MFEDKSINKYVVYFLAEPITITKVAAKVEIKNRRKLTDMVHYLSEYKMPKVYGGKNSKPIRLELTIISDYASELFNLNREEKDSLFMFISEETIKKFLLKNNRNLDQLLNKLILWVIKVNTVAKMPKIIDPVYVSDFDALLYEDYSSPEKWELEIALTRFANNNRNGFSFIDKIKKSNRTTSINIRNLYELIETNLIGHQQNLEYRISVHKKLRRRRTLIYDPYTNILQKRKTFMKGRDWA